MIGGRGNNKKNRVGNGKGKKEVEIVSNEKLKCGLKKEFECGWSSPGVDRVIVPCEAHPKSGVFKHCILHDPGGVKKTFQRRLTLNEPGKTGRSPQSACEWANSDHEPNKISVEYLF